MNGKQYLIKLDNVRREAVTIGLIIGILFGGMIASIWFYAPNQNLQNQVTQLQSQVNSLKTEADKVAGLRGQITSLTSEKTALQNQLAILNSQIISLQSALENKNQEITGLTSSYSELNEKYNTLLDAFLQQEYPTHYESLSNYKEVDPDNSITETDARISWNKMDRSLSRWAWSDYIDDSNLLVHQFYFCISQLEAGDSNVRVIVNFWMLGGTEADLAFYASQDAAVDDKYNIVFTQTKNGNSVFIYNSVSFFEPLNTNEVYLAKITRNGDVFQLQVFRQLDHQILIDSGPQTGLFFKAIKVSLAVIGGPFGDDNQDWSTGYVEYLQFL